MNFIDKIFNTRKKKISQEIHIGNTVIKRDYSDVEDVPLIKDRYESGISMSESPRRRRSPPREYYTKGLPKPRGKTKSNVRKGKTKRARTNTRRRKRTRRNSDDFY